MRTRNLVIAGVIAVALSLVAVQAFALPQYYGWSSMMGRDYGQMNQGNGCNVMNNGMMGQGMMGNMMNGQSMNYQQCQQHMGPNGNQMLNDQHHQQQCQAMYQYCDT